MGARNRDDGGDSPRDREEPLDLVELSNWLLAGLVVAIVGAYFYRYATPSGVSGLVDRRAPSFQVEQVDADERIGVEDFRGKVVVLDFWATWCPPCHRQMAHLKELDRHSSVSDDVQVLLVNADESGPERRQKVRSYLDRRHLRFPTGLDDGSVQRKYGVRSFPTTVVVGPEGTVQFGEPGVHETGRLVDAVEQARE